MERMNVIVSLEQYFESVNFFGRERTEQIAYLLYYVTNVAELRKDMTPAIIANRLEDQIIKYPGSFKPTIPTVEEIASIMVKRKDCFVESTLGDKRDRKLGEIAYILTESRRRSLDKEFNKRIYGVYKKHGIIKDWITYLFAIMLMLTLISFSIGFHNHSCIGISWEEYKDKVEFNDISDGERGEYLLYYVTEVLQFKKGMTAAVISDRLNDLGYVTADKDVVEQYLEGNTYIVQTDSLYSFSPLGVEAKDRLIGRKIMYDKENISMGWVMSNISFEQILTLGFSLLSGIWVLVSLGYKIGQDKKAYMD